MAASGLPRGPHFFWPELNGRFPRQRQRLSRGARFIQDNTKRVRVNRQIRISPLRVIAADGSQMGILDLDAALAAAVEQGLDLVERISMPANNLSLIFRRAKT